MDLTADDDLNAEYAAILDGERALNTAWQASVAEMCRAQIVNLAAARETPPVPGKLAVTFRDYSLACQAQMDAWIALESYRQRHGRELALAVALEGCALIVPPGHDDATGGETIVSFALYVCILIGLWGLHAAGLY